MGSLCVRCLGPLLAVVFASAVQSHTSAAQTLAAASPPPQPADMTAAPPSSAIGGDIARTRFVVGLEKPVEFQVFSLANPNRVIIELPDVKMQMPAGRDEAVGLVKAFYGGIAGQGRTRIVIDVARPVVVESAKIEKAKDGKGHRLALEIVAAQPMAKSAALASGKVPASGLGASGLQPPLPQPAQRAKQKAARAFKPVIVLDPGHGGNDTGGMKNGTVEKEVVLAFSRALRDKLNATGRYKVLMTRDTDVFVELDERRAFAERNNANLFIAVHADYASTNASGATVYSLRDTVARELQRSAKGDAAGSVLSGSEVASVKQASGDVDAVRGILADLAEREVEVTPERTSVFARSIIQFMGATTTLRDDPDQQAAFRVLKTAKVPSVLLELAYVTNKQDAQNLKSDAWRDKVATSIVTAVENYFSHQVAHLPM
jgi:N-acetylmuramoyl-L-alanine amidase